MSERFIKAYILISHMWLGRLIEKTTFYSWTMLWIILCFPLSHFSDFNIRFQVPFIIALDEHFIPYIGLKINKKKKSKPGNQLHHKIHESLPGIMWLKSTFAWYTKKSIIHLKWRKTNCEIAAEAQGCVGTHKFF